MLSLLETEKKTQNTSENNTISFLDNAPKDILLYILKYINHIQTLLPLRLISKKFNELIINNINFFIKQDQLKFQRQRLALLEKNDLNQLLIQVLEDKRFSKETILKTDIPLIAKVEELFSKLSYKSLKLLASREPEAFALFLENSTFKKIYLEKITNVNNKPYIISKSAFNISYLHHPNLKEKVKNTTMESYILYLQAKYNFSAAEIILSDPELKKHLLDNPIYLVKLGKHSPELAQLILMDKELLAALPPKEKEILKVSVVSRILGAIVGGLVGIITQPFISFAKTVKYTEAEGTTLFGPITFICGIFYGLIRGIHRGALGGIIEGLKIPSITWHENGCDKEIFDISIPIETIFPPYAYWTPVPTTVATVANRTNNFKVLSLEETDLEQQPFLTNPREPVLPTNQHSVITSWKKVFGKNDELEKEWDRIRKQKLKNIPIPLHISTEVADEANGFKTRF